MPLHLIKLCVGAGSIEALRSYQAKRAEIAHVTRMMPSRRAELLAGGSLYWVIKGEIRVRQRLRDIEAAQGRDGIKRCRLVLEKDLVPTVPWPRRAFQGWRYLPAADAPPDLDAGGGGGLPEALRLELAALGLL